MLTRAKLNLFLIFLNPIFRDTKFIILKLLNNVTYTHTCIEISIIQKFWRKVWRWRGIFYHRILIFSRFSRRRKRFRSFAWRRDAAYDVGYTVAVNFESGWYWVNPRPARARNNVGLTAGTTFADLSRCLNISSSAAAVAAASASLTPRG